ncbi:MAG: OmpW family outer membrane protein [Pseudomonadota bacterium]|nr:OmpW family outer membrane protein [Pseudomonadota bacterium]
MSAGKKLFDNTPLRVMSGLLLACILLWCSPAAIAQTAGDTIIRLRALAIDTNTDGTSAEMGGKVKTGNDLIPELDITYFFTDQFSVETMLGVAKYNVQLDDSALGNMDIGTVKKLPTALAFQFHPAMSGKVRPYVGAGVSYTMFFDERVGRSITDVEYRDELGFIFQAGLNYYLDNRFSINLDVKKYIIETDMKMNNRTINARNVSIDPLMVGVGIGINF